MAFADILNLIESRKPLIALDKSNAKLRNDDHEVLDTSDASLDDRGKPLTLVNGGEFDVHNHEKPVVVEPDQVGVDAATPKPGPRGKGMTHEKLNEINSAMDEGSQTREIAKLLSDYDAASKNSTQNKAFNQFTRAGMSVGHAMGGEKPDEGFLKNADDIANAPVENVLMGQKLKQGVQDQHRKNRTADSNIEKNATNMDETEQDITKKSLANDNEQDMQDPTSAVSDMARQFAGRHGYKVPDKSTARDIIDTLPLTKEEIDTLEKKYHEQQSNDRTDKIVAAENLRNRQTNATGIAKTILGSDSRESIAGMRGLELQQKLQERAIPDFKWVQSEDGKIPSQTSSNRAREMAGEYRAVEPVMRTLITLMHDNPRNFWATDNWNKAMAKFAFVYQGLNKINKNGVMNGKDWENLQAQTGDPNSAAQWVNQGGLTRLIENYQNTKNKFIQTMRYEGYEPGHMTMSDVGAYNNAGGGGSGSGGNTLQPTQEALDNALEATGTGIKAPMKGQAKPIQKTEKPTAEGLRAKLAALRGK